MAGAAGGCRVQTHRGSHVLGPIRALNTITYPGDTRCRNGVAAMKLRTLRIRTTELRARDNKGVDRDSTTHPRGRRIQLLRGRSRLRPSHNLIRGLRLIGATSGPPIPSPIRILTPRGLLRTVRGKRDQCRLRKC